MDDLDFEAKLDRRLALYRRGVSDGQLYSKRPNGDYLYLGQLRQLSWTVATSEYDDYDDQCYYSFGFEDGYCGRLDRGIVSYRF